MYLGWPARVGPHDSFQSVPDHNLFWFLGQKVNRRFDGTSRRITTDRSGDVSRKQEDLQSPCREFGRIRDIGGLDPLLDCCMGDWDWIVGL